MPAASHHSTATTSSSARATAITAVAEGYLERGLKIGGVPIVSYDPSEDVGFGANVRVTDFGEAVRPFVFSVEAQVFAARNGVQTHYLSVDVPEILPSWRLLGTVAYRIPGGQILVSSLERVLNVARSNSLWTLTFGLACCAMEMMATGAAGYDWARFGFEVPSASPRRSIRPRSRCCSHT